MITTTIPQLAKKKLQPTRSSFTEGEMFNRETTGYTNEQTVIMLRPMHIVFEEINKGKREKSIIITNTSIIELL